MLCDFIFPNRTVTFTMKKSLLIILALSFLYPFSHPNAQSRARQARSNNKTNAALNPQIKKIAREISPSNIEAIIKKLVSFHTRHSLSETESDTRGIGAARRWIKSEFERYSKESGGRIKVEFDEFTQPPVARVPKPTQLVNVVATLPGRQA